jgi:hypothetical protein
VERSAVSFAGSHADSLAPARVDFSQMSSFSAACLALGFSKPAVKRTIKVELFPATLKRCGKELNVDDAL